MSNKKTDESIISQIKIGDSFAEKELYDRYKLYSLKLANQYYTTNYESGITYAEFYSVALASIFIALKTYDLKRNSFYPYWKSVAVKQLYSYIVENSYKFGAKMFRGISLDSLIVNKDGNSTPLGEIVSNPHLREDDYEESYTNVLSRLEKELLSKNIKFSSIERKIILLLRDGLSNKEICQKLKIKPQRLYYLRRTIKSKVSSIICK